MAFINSDGEAISFESSELIQELKSDIAEFGGEMLVEVITEERRGVVIYKDYNLIDDDENTAFKVTEKEKIQKVTASALLLLYEQQNSIL